MSVTVLAVHTEAAALLNDTSQNIYTNTVLLPFMKRAYDDYLRKVMLQGHPLQKEISAAITVAALATTVTLPSDLLEPVDLEERTPGETDDLYIPMERKSWEPTTAQSTILTYWVWREEAIQLLGATAAREVRIRYFKSLSIVDTTTVISQTMAKGFLAAQLAGYAAFFIGNNPTRAEACFSMAENALADILNIAVKSSQALPKRRRPFYNRGFRF